MRFSSEFPAEAEALRSIREVVGEAAREAGASSVVTAAAVQSVHEAAVNVVVHAYDGDAENARIVVEGDNGDGWLRYTVTDTGSGFRPRRSSPGYGLGLALIAQLADEFQIRDAPGGGVEVLVSFRL